MEPRLSYPGGKNGAGVYQQIINQMPPHSLYIEPFLGGGAVLRHKRAAAATIAIDSDDRAIAEFQGAGLPGVTVICGDAISWLEDAAAASAILDDALIYADPPYVRSTRRSMRDLYRFEMTDLQHRQLLRCLRGLNCAVIISGYWSSLYADELHDWRTLSFKTMTRGGGVAIEWLWMNYPEPFELHDYRYLGQNFRERERIKRKQARWADRLRRMTPIERYSMLDTIEHLRCSLATNDAADDR